MTRSFFSQAGDEAALVAGASLGPVAVAIDVRGRCPKQSAHCVEFSPLVVHTFDCFFGGVGACCFLAPFPHGEGVP